MRSSVLVALTFLTLPSLALAHPHLHGCSSTSSFAPRPQRHSHVYGTPIGSPILGHAKTQRHSHLPKKPARVAPPSRH